ncbi:uncharacterized protein LOC132754592 [Ruditapes philippinarum]|uniref:uncharacterized protein LOC132754592 n=1 Tax=Ruditapes philippinarum TaxID=129788 RepID=UPI00295AC5E1|nr:uncharacterized protein LOC132754592 [Ruditapes philippinarum]
MAHTCVTLFYFTVILALTAGQHKHNNSPNKNAKEEYGIEFVTSGTNDPVWTIQKNNQVVKLINDYVKTNQNKVLNGNGYKGYKVNHKVGGVLQHTWIIPRCGSPTLEKQIYQTAPATTPRQYEVSLDAALNLCPKPAPGRK